VKGAKTPIRALSGPSVPSADRADLAGPSPPSDASRPGSVIALGATGGRIVEIMVLKGARTPIRALSRAVG